MLRPSARHVDQLFESKLSLLAILDRRGRCLRISAAWSELLGWRKDELVGRQVMELLSHPDDLGVARHVQQQLDHNGHAPDMACRIRDVRGEYHDIVGQVQIVGGLVYIDARDMTREHQAQRALRELNRQLQDTVRQLREKESLLLAMAESDALTGVANRRRFDEAFRREWLQCARSQLPLAVALVDVDFFKQFNDQYGHIAGDACLKAVARTMQEHLGRPHDLLARYGGEEFVVLLPATDLAGAIQVADRLREAVEVLGIAHARSVAAPHVTVSIGVRVVIPCEATPREALLHAADEALYRAKVTGRNRTVA